MQLKDKDKGLAKYKLKLETMCLRIEDDECPNLWYYSDKMVLTVEKAIKEDNPTVEPDHSYTPFLV